MKTDFFRIFSNVSHGNAVLILVCSALLSMSCERILDGPFGNSESSLYLESFPAGGSDTTYVYVFGTRALGAGNVARDLKNLSVGMSAGGRRCSLVVKSIEGHRAVLYTLDSMQPGDEVILNASADGYPDAGSVSVVPDAPAFELSRPSPAQYRLTFDTRSSGGRKHYYGVRIHGIKSYGTESLAPGDPGYSMSEEPVEFKMSCSTSLELSQGDDIMHVKRIITYPVNGHDMVIFEDDGGASGTFEALVSIPAISDREEYYNGAVWMRRCRYQVEVFSISEEAYRFLNPQVNYSMLSAGLVSPFVPCGNVSGGYGILSCMGRGASEWMPNLVQNANR